jgi:accessory colonization factor AcfC
MYIWWYVYVNIYSYYFFHHTRTPDHMISTTIFLLLLSAEANTIVSMNNPKNVASLARYILSDDCKSIAVLTGAGVSVASGVRLRMNSIQVTVKDVVGSFFVC